MSSEVTRRAVLAAVGTVGTTALAGCGGGQSSASTASDDSSGASTPTPTSTPMPSTNVITTTETVTENGTAYLRVTLADGTSVGSVRFLKGDRELQTRSPGVGTIVRFMINEELEGGEYRVVATQDGTEIDSTTVSLERAISIEDVKIVPHNGLATNIRLNITNTGDLPVNPEMLAATGNLPNPHKPDRYNPSVWIVKDSVGQYSHLPGQTIPVQAKQTIFHTETMVKAQNADAGCNGQPRTATLTYRTKRGITKTVNITYSLSGEAKNTPRGDVACSEWSLENWKVQS